MRNYIRVAIVVGILTYLCAVPAHAAQLTAVSDTISTSRPSASAVLSADQAAAATNFSVVDLGSANGNMYIASDSATFLAGGGETQNSNVNYIASMSAQLGAGPFTRTVYMTTTITNSHHKGDAVIVPITAVHSVGFTTATTIPVSGKIILTFPAMGAGETANAASPSASTFETNGISATQIKVVDGSTDITTNFTGGTGGSIAVTAPTAGNSPIVTLTLNNASTIALNHNIKIFLGCTTVAAGACTVQSPLLINPNKISTAGTADSWRLQIDTQDASSLPLDTAKTKIDTIESVQVYATVEPTLTFTIAGQTNGSNYSTIPGVSNCASETSNTGIDSTPTVVNLGTLNNSTTINTIGQTLTVSTNGASGYVITATSSGHFVNPTSGFWLSDANGGTGLTANDTPIPAVMSGGTPTAAFGISPCGAHVPTSTPNWGGATGKVNNGATSTARFSNPYNSGTTAGYYATIASYNGGPISADVTVVRYAATITGTTPPGIYQNTFTYVATATF